MPLCTCHGIACAMIHCIVHCMVCYMAFRTARWNSITAHVSVGHIAWFGGRCTPCSYGSCSYGLCSYCPYTSGLCSCGPYSYGLYSYIVMAYIIIVYIVLAYIVMACFGGGCTTALAGKKHDHGEQESCVRACIRACVQRAACARAFVGAHAVRSCPRACVHEACRALLCVRACVPAATNAIERMLPSSLALCTSALSLQLAPPLCTYLKQSEVGSPEKQ